VFSQIFILPGLLQWKRDGVLQNMIDTSIAAICFWLLGYGFAYGDDVTGFIGKNNFANTVRSLVPAGVMACGD